MQLLKFKVKFETEKSISEILSLINNTLDLDFKNAPYQQGKNWTDWKYNAFGLEITVTYFSKKGNYSISGCRSERVASLIPIEEDLLETDISTEILEILKLAALEDNWYIE